MQDFQRWMRTRVFGDLSYVATGITILALGLHYAGHMTPAAACGAVGAVLVALKYRAKRKTKTET
jgi:uncharacterized membrane protein (DUF4010 family)